MGVDDDAGGASASSGAPMGESHASRALRAIPWGFLGMLAMVVCIERTVIEGRLAFSNPVGDSWGQTARQLKKGARDRDLLCFGDSLVKHGVNPLVLRERTGTSAYNLAVVGGSAPSSYFLLRRALEAGARPSTIVVDFARELLQFEPESKTKPSPWADLLDLRESLELCWAARNPELFGWVALARFIPSVKNRHEVRAYVRAKFRGENPDEVTIALLLRRNWNLNMGALVNPKMSYQDVPVPDGSKRQVGTWRPHPANAHFVRKFLELAAQARINVVWLLPPICPGTQGIWESWGDEELFDTFARSMLRRYPNLMVLDGRHAGYGASVFHDAVHLDRDGASALSETVADLLKGGGLDPKAARWVALPAFRIPAAAVPLEDLDQSRIAVARKVDEIKRERR